MGDFGDAPASPRANTMAPERNKLVLWIRFFVHSSESSVLASLVGYKGKWRCWMLVPSLGKQHGQHDLVRIDCRHWSETCQQELDESQAHLRRDTITKAGNGRDAWLRCGNKWMVNQYLLTRHHGSHFGFLAKPSSAVSEVSDIFFSSDIKRTSIHWAVTSREQRERKHRTEIDGEWTDQE